MAREAHYPVSDSKRERLYQRGIIPHSNIAQVVGVALGVVGISLLCVSYIAPKLLEFAREMFSGKGSTILYVISDSILLGFAGAMGVVFSGLLQRRFRLGYLADVKETTSDGSETRLGLMFLCLGVVGLMALVLTKSSSLTEAIYSTGELFPLKFVNEALGVVFLISLAIALIAWVLAYIRFEREHRMTREELLAELRETEVNPHMKANLEG